MEKMKKIFKNPFHYSELLMNDLQIIQREKTGQVFELNHKVEILHLDRPWRPALVERPDSCQDIYFLPGLMHEGVCTRRCASGWIIECWKYA